MLQGTSQARAVMDGQGGHVQHPAAGFIAVGKVGAGVAAAAVQEEHSPHVWWVFGCAVCVEGQEAFVTVCIFLWALLGTPGRCWCEGARHS